MSTFEQEWSQLVAQAHAGQSTRMQLNTLHDPTGPPPVLAAPAGSPAWPDLKHDYPTMNLAAGQSDLIAETVGPKSESAATDTSAAASEMDGWDVGAVLARLATEWRSALAGLRRDLESNATGLRGTVTHQRRTDGDVGASLKGGPRG
ncbi:hypothetical protein SRB5_45010 [Streptomyces sp. RB5]|uniref:Uncharacterized protein n=1 Tax=Streptomyces smaragdinus TaxID=2585196 RepID=A0A7K0CLH6_9ACTN|nr:hypothetical protein [Streptomyces smaragdinus]MQY14337.1 hypothetical protein [Streptomyces smaragdinus]